jgi:uncharacterized protein (DUF362 family)
MTRRSFVTSAAATTAAVAAGPLQARGGGKSEIVVGKGSAAEMIPKIIGKMGGIEAFVKPKSRVLIKPNMSFANPPEWATTTSPEAVRTVTKMCLDAGAKRVIVADNTLREPELCKQKSGIAEAVKDLKGVVVFTPKQDRFYVEESNDKATNLVRVKVLKEVLRADTLVALPTAKSHSAGGVSLSIKGLMGLIGNRSIMHSEMDLHTAIAEQLYYIRPTLCIVDASRALLDNGPAGPGKVAQLDTFVGGTDPVAVDSYSVTLASWYGRTFDGTNVAHLKKAAEMGFGNVESSMITEIAV